MFGSAILEIAIGLIFFYLVLSLVVTAVSEVVASMLKWRANNLFDGVRELLRDPNLAPGVAHWADKLYAHPLISALSLGTNGKPSYIPSRTFALALIDLVAPIGESASGRRGDAIRTALAPGASPLPEDLRRVLSLLLEEAGGDPERFKVSVETWFNSSMERVSGWYKRKAQTANLLIAAAVTLAFNADTISIIGALENEKVRSGILTQAELAVQQAAAPAASPAAADPAGQAAVAKASQAAVENLNQAIAKVEKLGLPIGWKDVTWYENTDAESLGLWVTRVLGWLLTICAVSLGAPFWFDLLNKFMNIRASGKAPEEAPKDPKEIPQPRGPGGDAPVNPEPNAPLAEEHFPNEERTPQS